MFAGSRLSCACALALFLCSALAAQQPVPMAAGDAPTAPGPLAQNLPTDLHSKSIRQLERKVADWQMTRLGPGLMPRTWDFGTLGVGLAAAAHNLGDERLAQPITAVGDHFGWRIEHTLTPALDYGFALALIEASRGNPKTLSAVRLRLDGDLQDPFNPDKPLWNSTLELFAEAPAAAQFTAITSDATYSAFVNREWHRTEKLLFDPTQHLFAANAAALQLREKNGQPHFEARANGMALAALVRVLASYDSDDPLRPLYIARLREVASALAAAQGSDGLWRPGLLDPAAYPQPAVAGSAFITYALAWGIVHHHLDARIYLPVVERAWAGLAQHIYQDGRLGSIEPPDDPTGLYPPGSSWNYGVGAFLLAAGEVDALSQRKHW